MKIQVTTLTDLFTVIRKQVESSAVPHKQHKRLIKTMCAFAQQAHQIGQGRPVEMEVSDEHTPS